MELTLQAEIRSPGKASQARRAKQVPCVVYGGDTKPMAISVDASIFRRIYKQAGETGLVDMELAGNSKPLKVLVQDIQYHPVTDEVSHVDFLSVRMDRKLTTTIPVEVVGVAPAVKDFMGVLTVFHPHINVRCLPGDLMKSFVIDVSVLKTFHDSIHIRDIKVSDKIQILDDVDKAIATVLPPRKEEEVAAVAVAAAAPVAGAPVAGATPAAGGAASAAAAKAPAAKAAPSKK